MEGKPVFRPRYCFWGGLRALLTNGEQTSQVDCFRMGDSARTVLRALGYPGFMSENRESESLRELLCDKDGTLAFLDYGLASDWEQEGHADPKHDPFFEYIRRTARSNVENVFRYSESPIETIFLNSLVIAFARSSPTNLYILPPPNADVCEAVQEKRSRWDHCQQWYWMFQELAETDSIDSFRLFLEDRGREGVFTAAEVEDMHGMILLTQATHLHQAFHLTMQARFTNLKVDDKTLRADAYIWIPSDPDFNLIVECDGYQFHSDQAAFGRDRKRDRAFAAAGYRVLRFSGREICEDPARLSIELFDYLEGHSKLFKPEELHIPEELKDSLRAHAESFRSHFPPQRYQRREVNDDDDDSGTQ